MFEMFSQNNYKNNTNKVTTAAKTINKNNKNNTDK